MSTVQGAFSLYHAHKDERLILPGLHTVFHINAVYGVVRALNQLLNGIVLLLGMHHTVLCGFCGNRDHIDTLCDVQLSGLAVTQSVIIIHPVGNIAALLGLKKQCTALNGMYGTGINLDEVTGLNRDLTDELFPLSFLDHLLQFFPGLRVVSNHQRSIFLTV